MISIFIVTITALIVLALPSYFRARAQSLKQVREWQKEFYDTANVLLRDPDTPDNLVRIIDTMIKDYNDQKWHLKLILAFVTGRFSKEATKSESVSCLGLLLDRMAPNKKEMAQRLFSLHFLINTGLAGITGTIVRLIIFYQALRSGKVKHVPFTYAPEAVDSSCLPKGGVTA